MNNEERYKTALIVLINNLVPPGGWDFRPMSSEMCGSLATFAKDVLEGMTPEEAGRRQATAQSSPTNVPKGRKS